MALLTVLRLNKMTKYIQIESESDFIFLRNMFDRAMKKIKTEVSKFDLEQAETITRIHDSLYNASDSPEVENKLVEKEEKPETKKRVSKNPKSVRTASNGPKLRVNLCEKHPYYGAVRAPQQDCEGCWSAYQKMNPDSYDKKRRDFVRKAAKQQNA